MESGMDKEKDLDCTEDDIRHHDQDEDDNQDGLDCSRDYGEGCVVDYMVDYVDSSQPVEHMECYSLAV
jgi:hypothetical protein